MTIADIDIILLLKIAAEKMESDCKMPQETSKKFLLHQIASTLQCYADLIAEQLPK